jgi:hypothetical protein
MRTYLYFKHCSLACSSGRPVLCTLLLDCSITVVPEVVVMPSVVRARDIAVDVMVMSVVGAGPPTPTLDVL